MSQRVEVYSQNPRVLQFRGDEFPRFIESSFLEPRWAVSKHSLTNFRQGIQRIYEFVAYLEGPEVAVLLGRNRDDVIFKVYVSPL